jgi:peptidoglycan lytic transglycosylase D
MPHGGWASLTGFRPRLPIHEASMLRWLSAAICLLLVAAASAEEALPRPPALAPNVRFWKRIYAEVDGHAGLIHDSDHLDVVYETLHFPEGLSDRARERRVEREKRHLRGILMALSRGKRSGLSAEQAEVLSRWPEGVSNSTLRAAAHNLRFQLGQADKFRAGLVRAGAWRDFIERTLREHGVPVELAALPHVESSYNPRAYSRVGAAGLWQFTRSTGARYLRVDHVVDERLDPYAATVGAARLLRENYRLTQSWPLAITAYNHGAAGMRRAAEKLGTRDIGTIVRRYRSRSFGFASRNFYASFLAALDVDHDAERYFGPLTPHKPVAYAVVELPHYYPAQSLAQALGVDVETLRTHNAALRPEVWSGSKYVPRGFELRVPRSELSAPPEELLAQVPESERYASQHRDRYYKVHRGDTLSRIAGRYDVSESQLVALNNLRSRHEIRAGQVLVLPDDARGAPVQVARQEPPADGVYEVRRGDTVSIIAKRFGVSQTALAAANDLQNRHRIRIGQRLAIPGAAPEPAPPVVLASASVVPLPVPARAEAAPAVADDATAVTDEAPAVADDATAVADDAPAVADDTTAVADDAPAVADDATAVSDDAAAAADDTTAVADDETDADNDADAGTAPPGTLAEGSDPADVGPEPDTATEAAPDQATADEELADSEDEGALAEPSAADERAADADEPTPSEDTAVEAVAPSAPLVLAPGSVPDPSDYAVHGDGRIIVQAEETLGHYAEWLELRASDLRRINHLRFGHELPIGRPLRLDFRRVTPEEFEQRRLEYHRTLQAEFFDAYVVTGTEQHVLKRGETLWYLANKKYRLPVWLLRQYNPDLDFAALRAGVPMVVPVVEQRQQG